MALGLDRSAGEESDTIGSRHTNRSAAVGGDTCSLPSDRSGVASASVVKVDLLWMKALDGAGSGRPRRSVELVEDRRDVAVAGRCHQSCPEALEPGKASTQVVVGVDANQVGVGSRVDVADDRCARVVDRLATREQEVVMRDDGPGLLREEGTTDDASSRAGGNRHRERTSGNRLHLEGGESADSVVDP